MSSRKYTSCMDDFTSDKILSKERISYKEEFMRNSVKIVCSILLMFVLSMGMTTVVKADTTTVTKEDVTVEITTDKDSYKAGEQMVVKVVVTNKSQEELTDVNIRLQLPEGMTFAKAEDKVLVIDKLVVGESKEFEVIGKQAFSILPIVLIQILDSLDY